MHRKELKELKDFELLILLNEVYSSKIGLRPHSELEENYTIIKYYRKTIDSMKADYVVNFFEFLKPHLIPNIRKRYHSNDLFKCPAVLLLYCSWFVWPVDKSFWPYKHSDYYLIMNDLGILLN